MNSLKEVLLRWQSLNAATGIFTILTFIPHARIAIMEPM